MKLFCELLRETREKKKMLRVHVANEFGWTAMYYGRYEKGDLYPTSANIHLFAKFIGIDIDTLKKIIEEEIKNNYN